MIDAIVFDLDGTLFNLPPDCMPNGVFCANSFRNNSHLAEPIPQMINLYELYVNGNHNYEMIILTARPDFMREQTESHLSRYGLPVDKLIMRKELEAPDVVTYKVRQLQALTEQGFKVEIFFEDKQEIVEAANAAGYYAVKVP